MSFPGNFSIPININAPEWVKAYTVRFKHLVQEQNPTSLQEGVEPGLLNTEFSEPT